MLPLTAAVSTLHVLPSAPSTNDELLARAGEAADFTVVLTTDQTEGRGRLGRSWVSRPGEALAVSVLLRPRLPRGEVLERDRWGWIPLIAGVAMVAAVSAAAPTTRATVKWPNDVLIGGRKVCGILTELTATGDAIVVGAGVNLTTGPKDLPTPTSTSLAIEGATLGGDELVDLVSSTWLTELRRLGSSFIRVGGDADGSGIRELVIDSCDSLGRRVRVALPDGTDLLGTAVDIDPSGRILVKRESDGRVQAVAAGDVTHLRYE